MDQVILNEIPKIIHLIWIGGNPKSELVIRCVESWRKYLPDYKIIEWNEENYNVRKNRYISQAYSEKKWAFVSDFMRFDILYQYGGIYIDTDVEFLKELPEAMLKYQAFTGMESNGFINPGLIYAALPQNELIKQILETYDTDTFDINNLYTVCDRVTELMTKYGYEISLTNQFISNTMIFRDDYFCGYDKDVHELKITDNTISIHHYAGTWMKNNRKKLLREFLKKCIGIKNYRKLLVLKRKLCGVSGRSN